MINAEKEYQLKKSSSKVSGVAFSICKSHKRAFYTVKYQLVLEQIQKAIQEYDSHVGTFEQREKIRILENIQRKEYHIEKEKHRIKIDLCR